jgi:hypothetical protein
MGSCTGPLQSEALLRRASTRIGPVAASGNWAERQSQTSKQICKRSEQRGYKRAMVAFVLRLLDLHWRRSVAAALET